MVIQELLQYFPMKYTQPQAKRELQSVSRKRGRKINKQTQSRFWPKRKRRYLKKKIFSVRFNIQPIANILQDDKNKSLQVDISVNVSITANLVVNIDKKEDRDN